MQKCTLRYIDDDIPGIERVRRGATFQYRWHGHPVREAATLARIAALVIPPAWTDVWICPSPRGHIQATGRDARGRKQYRYHAEWRRTRDSNKYERLIAFAETLPRLRARVEQDLRRPKLDRERVLAVVVRLLELTRVRVGNEEYARTNKSYGLTTLRDQHVQIRGARVRFRFRGKSRVEHEIEVQDARLARLVKRCQEVPGQLLFQYFDETGERRCVRSQDVNDYLRAAMGEAFTAKDFRTWSGTVLAAQALSTLTAAASATEARRQLVGAVREVAAKLGNTPAVCRSCYIHPGVFDAHSDGVLAGLARARAHRQGLQPVEAAVLVLLQSREPKGLKRAA
ncbi:MAG: DNA topoisomerase IB [Myxococcaceae bacterium]|nr:DNA topoisomerase IB [Myxococcaceae bacterium]